MKFHGKNKNTHLCFWMIKITDLRIELREVHVPTVFFSNVECLVEEISFRHLQTFCLAIYNALGLKVSNILI